MPALLNTISHYSLRRGVLSPELICRTVKELGYPAVALTDRDNLYGLPEFLYHAEQQGLRAIIGCELSAREGAVLLYAHGTAGFANLCRVISEKHCEKHFDAVPSILADPEGLHAVTDHLGLLEALEEKLPCYYRMRRPRRPPAQVRERKTPCLVVPPFAFLSSQDYEMHRLMRAIDCNTTLSRLAPDEAFSAQSVAVEWRRVRERFEVFDEALAATEEFCRTICSRSAFGTVIAPPAYTRYHAQELLRRKAYEGARRRYGKLSQQVTERIEYELGMIGRKGFASYFLIVDDIVRQSPRTCGRGSAAASIVAYSLGITNVDPIRYNLMFERFLNPGRTDPPDIDVDFAWDERDSVLDYVFERYGNEHTAMVATHMTFGARMALREVARVYGLTEAEISAATRKLPWFFHEVDNGVDIDTLLRNSPKTQGVILDPPWPEVVAWAQRLMGKPSGIGTHPGGVVITPGPIKSHAPVQYSAKGYPIVQWEKDGVEEMGLVKIDLLGNRSLAVIRDALANIRAEGVKLDEQRWDPARDPVTIDLLARGKSMGVFYVESPAMRLLQEKSKTGDFEHMVIHSSIIRPAANRYVREYIRRLHGGRYSCEHPTLATVLAETYGIMVYQEDVTKVAMALAGFDSVDGDALRKIMAKKTRRKKFEDYRRMFFEGARRNGVEVGVIEAVWKMMLSFSGYSFCKPHSASYVQVSFQSAYLKAHYPAAFMAAVISNFGGFYTIQAYVGEAQRLGVKVLPPHVNRSRLKCVSRENSIRIGLQIIKGLRAEAQKTIIENRDRYGPYASLVDLCERTGLGESDAERLVLAGACDSLHPLADRTELLWRLRSFYRSGTTQPNTPRLRPYSRVQLLASQYDTLGFLADFHPILLVRPRSPGRVIRISRIRAHVGRRVSFYGWCVTSRTLSTRKGEGMEFVTFEDETGIVEAVLFPPAYRSFTRHIAHQEAFLVRGKVTEDFGAVMVEVKEISNAKSGVRNGDRLPLQVTKALAKRP